MTADPDETIIAAAQRMAEHGVGDLVVVEHDGGEAHPIGIVTDRDLVTRGLARAGSRVLDLTVRDLMHGELVTGFSDESVETVLCRIKLHGIRRIPIVDRAGVLQGILTLDDIVSWLGEQLNDAAGLIERQAAAPT